MKKVIKTEEEWRKVLTPQQFNILREKGTEYPNSCSLLAVKENGHFSCVACGNKLFKSGSKFESGTGWPSFSEPYSEDALEYREDNSIYPPRTEVLCAKCEGHLGHVFNDGKPPNRKRYCINGAVMKFKKV